jgi:Protein of unknown function (DUF4232)
VFRILGRSGHWKPGVSRAVAALICVAVATGCGSSSGSSSAPSSPAAPASSPAAPASSPAAPSTPLSPAVTGTSGPSACATSGLSVTLGAPGGYAGGVVQAIVFTNRSGATCTLYGYPGVSLVSAPPYTQIGLAARRTSTVPVKLITLAPGASANAMVQIVDALNFGSATCSPTKAAYLRVYPPNQTAPVYLANTSETCAQPVQTLSVTAVQAGSGATS